MIKMWYLRNKTMKTQWFLKTKVLKDSFSKTQLQKKNRSECLAFESVDPNTITTTRILEINFLDNIISTWRKLNPLTIVKTRKLSKKISSNYKEPKLNYPSLKKKKFHKFKNRIHSLVRKKLIRSFIFCKMNSMTYSRNFRRTPRFLKSNSFGWRICFRFNKHTTLLILISVPSKIRVFWT